MSSQVFFSAHARPCMARCPRYAGHMEGKVITVIVAQERDALIVITAY